MVEELDDAESSGLPTWIIYAALGVGNVLLLGIGFVVFRKVMGATKEPEDDAAEENIGDAPPPEKLRRKIWRARGMEMVEAEEDR